MQVLKKIGLGIAAMLASLNAFADYAWNFPLPATPMAIYDHYWHYIYRSVGDHDLRDICSP